MPSRRPPPARRTPAARHAGPAQVDRARTPARPTVDRASESETELPAYRTGADYEVPDADEQEGSAPSDAYPDDELSLTDQEASLALLEETRLAKLTSAPEAQEDEPEDENATRAGPPIHLEVISGPDQGKTRRFRGIRMVIGRTQECEFKLSDNSVSRRHVELVLGDAGVLLRDLGSGNGTKVNGARVSEKMLQDGDEISLGKTRLRYVDELVALRKREAQEDLARQLAEQAAAVEQDAEDEAPAPPQDAEALEAAPESEDAAPDQAAENPPEPRRDTVQTPLPDRAGPAQGGLRHSRGLWVALGALGLLLVVAWALSSSGTEPAPSTARAEQAMAQLLRARVAFDQGRFEEALTLVEGALRLSPEADPVGLALAARQELAAQRGYEEVLRLVEEADFEAARVKLAQVPLTAVLGEQPRRKVEEELGRAQLAHQRARARALLDEGDAQAAARVIALLPSADQQALQPRLDEVATQAALRREEETRERERQAANQRRAQIERRRAYMDQAFGQVARKFHAGEFTRAALECDRVVERYGQDAEVQERARNLKKWIPLFARYLNEGTRKFDSNNLEGAAVPLQQARDLYQKIGFQGALGTVLDEQLAAAALAAARAALARNDLAGAARHYRQAQGLGPSDVRPRQGLELVYEKAEQLYLEAYLMRERDPRGARIRFRMVMDVLPRDFETWGRAKMQLEKLDG
jgi:pSer/pThr/pTyr-binding forkhead associated (FHA) protein